MTTLAAYSPLKILYHSKTLSKIKKGEHVAPTHVQLVISDYCNQDCGFCAYRMSGYSSNVLFGNPDTNGRTNPLRMIGFDKCLEILDDCKQLGVKAVQFTGGGEPTVHPDHVNVFSSCLDKGMDMALVTNGVRMLEKLINVLMRSAWVRISIDAGTSKTYGSLRRVNEHSFNVVIKNIEALVKEKRKTNSEYPTIGVGFVVCKENWQEVLQCSKLAKELGVDNVRISAVFQIDGAEYFDSWYEECYNLCKEAESLTDNRFKVFNNFANRVDDLTQQSPDYSFCGIQRMQTYIGADLNVYRCCVLAYNPRGKLGSIKDARLFDLWNSEEIKEKFNSFDAKGCPQCMYNDKNRAILQGVSEPDRHANFI